MKALLAGFLALAWVGAVWAQVNLLELPPPVPNAAKQGASSAVGVAQPQPGTTAVGVSKSILNGPVALAVVEIKDELQRVSVKFTKVLAPGERGAMLDAARAVQRDVVLSCQRMCKAGRMPAPTISKESKLEFDMVVLGLKRPLTVPDMIALLSAKPLAKLEPAAVAPAVPAAVPPAGPPTQ